MHARTWAILSAAGLLVVLGCEKKEPASTGAADSALTLTKDQRARLAIEPVERTTFRPVIEVTATVAFNGDHSTQVISPISGPVARILAEPGTRVASGQALALVASPDFAVDLADYRKAVAAAANAERIAELDQRLFDNDALARRDLEQAQTDAAAAVADRDAALEQLRSLGVDSAAIENINQRRPSVSQAVIRAPISGTVVERLITPGQLLEAGATPSFTIADLSTVWVMANVFESDLPEISVGDSAEIKSTDGSRVYTGRVGYVAALVDPDTRATAVRVVADNPGGVFKRDMYVRVTIYARHQRTGILVSTAAVQRDEDNLPFLFVTMPDGSFARRHVLLGGRVGDRYEVTSGLEPGEQVVSEGGLFLRFAESQ